MTKLRKSIWFQQSLGVSLKSGSLWFPTNQRMTPENTSSHQFLDLSCMLFLLTVLLHSDTMIVSTVSRLMSREAKTNLQNSPSSL